MGVSSGGENIAGAPTADRVFLPSPRDGPRVTGGRDRACELVRGGRVGSQWQRTGRPGRHGNVTVAGSGGGSSTVARRRRAPVPGRVY